MLRRVRLRGIHLLPLMLAVVVQLAAAGVEVPAPVVNDPVVPAANGPVSAAIGFALLPGDLIQVDVYGHPDLSGQARIPASGGAIFPLIGEVAIPVGATPDVLADLLRARLEADYLRQATVTVTVKEHVRRMVYVLGSVVRPSNVELLPLDRLTALRAISACGGFLEEANRSGVMVVREDAAAKTTATLPVAADPLVGSDVQLQAGDLVVVPRLDRVYVLGQVNRPGAVTVAGGDAITVSKALSLAGGLDRYARENAVQLLRPGEAARTIDVEAILEGAAGMADPLLKPGDTLFVPTRRF